MPVDAIEQWSAALDALLVAGPMSLTPIERRARFDSALRAALPPRARAAFERWITSGTADALLDVCVWARAAVASRARVATHSGTLTDLASIDGAGSLAVALADQPVERWVDALATSHSHEAAALIATASGPLARATLSSVVEGDRGADTALALVGDGSDSTGDLIVWAETLDGARRAAALVALCRQRALGEAVRARMIAVAQAAELSSDDATECLRALCEHDVGASVDLLFSWLARGVVVVRAVHERVLRAMAFHDDGRWLRWVDARLESGEAAPWEIDALDRWRSRVRAAR